MRIGTVITTVISGLLFCLIIVFIARSPLLSSSSFYPLYMWLNILLLLVIYSSSLYFYWKGKHSIKYVMAFFSGVGIFIAITIIIIALLIGLANDQLQQFLTVIMLCQLVFITNVAWYIVTFNKQVE